MSRQARVAAEAVPHHVTQRGNNRQDIFLTDDDRRFYLAILREKLKGTEPFASPKLLSLRKFGPMWLCLERRRAPHRTG
jgi:hypothetical protein